MIQQFYSEYIFKRVDILIQSDSYMIIATLSIRANMWKTTKFSSMNDGGNMWYIQRTEYFYLIFVVVQSISCVQFFETPWSRLSLPVLHYVRSLLKFMYIESIMPSNNLIFCCPLLFLPSIFPSIRIFSKESTLLIRWPKYWNFNFIISPFNEYSGLISFRIDWFDLLAVQVTLESSPTLQFKSINSLALSLLYGSTLTSIHGYWKNHSFD